MKKRAFLNFGMSTLYQIASLLVGLVVPKIYTETFGSVYNGLNQTVTQVMSLLSVLQLGISAAAMQMMFRPIVENNKQMIASIYWDTGRQYKRMGYVFLVIVIPVVILFPFLIKENLSYFVIFYFLLIRTLSAATEYFFQAKYGSILVAHNLSYMIYVFNLILLSITTILHLVVLFTSKNILLYQTVILISTLLRFALVGTYVNKKFPFLRQYKRNLVPLEHASDRKNVLINEIANLVVDSTDLVVLSVFSGLVDCSIYSVYHFVVAGLWSILCSCREAVFSGIGTSFHSNFESFRRNMDTFETVYLSMSFFLFSVCIVLFHSFVEVYTANMDVNYYYAGFPILFVLCKLLSGIRIPSIVAVNVSGHFKQTKNYAIAESIINLSISLLLVKPLGIYGVLIGTLAGAAYRTPVLIHYVNKNIWKRKDSLCWKKVLIWSLFLLGCYLFSIFFPFSCSSLSKWFLLAVVCAVILLGVALLWLFLFDRASLQSIIQIVAKKAKNKPFRFDP